jgi:hypothetical protein
LDTLDDYTEEGELIQIYKDVNFNPNDGVSTEMVLNIEGESIPDYLIVSDRENTIVSRWFVAEAVRTRLGQYRMSLIRDVVADWYDEIVSAPAFIEKGYVSAADPAIYNSEAMTFNQIKTSEKLIKDFSNNAWIVGYIAKDTPGMEITMPAPGIVVNYPDGFESYDYNGISEDSGGKFYTAPNNYCVRINVTGRSGDWYINDTYCFAWDRFGNSISPFVPSYRTGAFYAAYLYTKTGDEGFTAKLNLDAITKQFKLRNHPEGLEYSNIQQACAAWIKSYDWTDIGEYATGMGTNAELQLLLAEEGKIIKDNNRYYRIHVNNPINDAYFEDVVKGKVVNGKNLYERLEELSNQKPFSDSFNVDTVNPYKPFELETSCVSYQISYEDITSSLALTTIEIPSERTHCYDQPYDIFAIPFGRSILNQASISSGNARYNEYCTKLFGDVPENVFTLSCQTTMEAGYKLAQELIVKLDKRLYDIQLLPFCPINRAYHSGGAHSVTFLPADNNLDYTTVTPMWHEYTQAQWYTVRAIDTFMWWIDRSQFSTDISESITLPSDPIEYKVANETDVYRLVSPNYNGTFEFSAAKNGGVFGWNVDCAYKPYAPYIKVSPLFANLYGKDFNDARGMIMSGDFSLSQTSDAYVQYQVNNKYFQNSFDRQIENMEVNNSIQREREWWSLLTGTAQGAAMGGILGQEISSGPIGAGIGAIAGAGLSYMAGRKDIQLNERARQEAIDYTKDQFGYQLRNIQALPYTLNKVSTFNPNYKLFPVLEYYTASETEKEALRNKIKYNGMTIMRIGTISEFQGSEPRYVKGKIIRLEGIKDDYHVLNAIAREIDKGVFI